MVSFTVTYDKDILEAIQADIAKAPETIRIFAEKTVPNLIQKSLTPLTTEPKEPTLPFVWSFDPIKQRRAQRWYFANKVKGRGGGRYVRTHQLVNNWKVTGGRFQDGSVITITNDTPGLDYVQGPRQVPSHTQSGWAQYDDVILKAEKQANDVLIDAWFDILASSSSGSKYK